VESFPTINGNRSTSGNAVPRCWYRCGHRHTRRSALVLAAIRQQHSNGEIIDLSAATPAWVALPNLNRPRMHQVNTVPLPDGRVLLAGEASAAPMVAGRDFDPRNPAAGWGCAPRCRYRAATTGGDSAGRWQCGDGGAGPAPGSPARPRRTSATFLGTTRWLGR
jgi:hypothetical protein